MSIMITVTGDDNLNKENFFNPLFENFPEAMARWEEWFADYKSRIKWNSYFYTFMKFEGLHFDMQTGILYEFFKAQSVTFMESAGSVYPNKEGIVKYFVLAIEKLNNIIVENSKRTEQ